MDRVRTRPAVESDWPVIEALLTEHALPLAGARENLRTYWVAVEESGIIGAAGIEGYGSVGLLRSVAVRRAHWTTGIGHTLVEVATAAAAGAGIDTLYLLTTTAAAYFEALGFNVVERNLLPSELRLSAEFRGACPDSAICMRRQIA